MSDKHVLSSIAIRNFKVIRNHTIYDLGDSSYFIGVNNAGKSTILKAIRYFFDDDLFQQDDDFLNRTERISKKGGSSKTEITVTFNIRGVTVTALRDSLKKKYGDCVSVTKEVSLSSLGAVTPSLRIRGINGVEESNDEDVKKLINSVTINYLHPQQGKELLAEAQQKLKRRLLDNWGRRDRSITSEIRKIEKQWHQFKDAANQYLSASLNESTQKMWSDSSVTIGLPDNIKDILDISQISFSGSKNSPSIDLSNQGAGAQSLILYFTHYMLDSDKTLFRAREHHPVWLVEEPESFLHYDLVSKLGDEFNSMAWRTNLQLLVSTHSPILLAKSRLSGRNSVWHMMRQDEQPISKASNAWSAEETDIIGKTLGDMNFKLYFEAATPEDQFFLEDSRQETVQAFEKIGIKVSHAIGGTGDIKNMVATLKYLNRSPSASRIIFVIDHDQGLKVLSNFVGQKIKESNNFTLHEIEGCTNAFFMLLPEGTASEDLYDEYDDIMDMIINELVDSSLKLKPSTPSFLSTATIKVRKNCPTTRAEIKKLLKNDDDSKRYFWKYVKDRDLEISISNKKAIELLINHPA